jgi:hypothetical protein
MKKLTAIVCLTASLTLISCSPPEQTAIVGSWKASGTNEGIAAFQKNGNFMLVEDRSAVTGRYSFVSNNKLKFDIVVTGAVLFTHTCDVVVTSEKLVMIGANGKKVEFLKEK